LAQEIQEQAESKALAIEDAYVKKNCGEYDMPCLDYHIHAPDYE